VTATVNADNADRFSIKAVTDRALQQIQISEQYSCYLPLQKRDLFKCPISIFLLN